MTDQPQLKPFSCSFCNHSLDGGCVHYWRKLDAQRRAPDDAAKPNVTNLGFCSVCSKAWDAYVLVCIPCLNKIQSTPDEAALAAIDDAYQHGRNNGRAGAMRAMHVTLDSFGAPAGEYPCLRIDAAMLAVARRVRDAIYEAGRLGDALWCERFEADAALLKIARGGAK